MNDILERLSRILEERKRADPDSSYVASLYAKGLDAILKKIGEEAAETLLAAKDGVPESGRPRGGGPLVSHPGTAGTAGTGTGRGAGGAGEALWPLGTGREDPAA